MVYYLEALRRIHAAYRPARYLEVGIRAGDSLACSSARSIAIDPEFTVIRELDLPVKLVRQTSDDYFAQHDPTRWLGGPIDLAFIDGMHLSEFALRDFINVERHAAWASMIVFDDMLPRNVDEAARERHTRDWTGDVFKIRDVLVRYRPDLTILTLATEPTGLMVVTGLDPRSTVLADHYDEIVGEMVYDDPQRVPDQVLERSYAVDPDRALDSEFFTVVPPGTSPKRRHRERLAAVHRKLLSEIGQVAPEPVAGE